MIKTRNHNSKRTDMMFYTLTSVIYFNITIPNV